MPANTITHYQTQSNISTKHIQTQSNTQNIHTHTHPSTTKHTHNKQTHSASGLTSTLPPTLHSNMIA